MRELLPMFLAGALGNQLLFEALGPRRKPLRATGWWWLPAFAGLALALAAMDATSNLLVPQARLFPGMTAMAAIALGLVRVEAPRRPQLLASLLGANLAVLAYSVIAAIAWWDAARSCIAASILLALLCAALPALQERMALADLSSAWRRGPLPMLCATMLGLAMAGLGRLLPW